MEQCLGTFEVCTEDFLVQVTPFIMVTAYVRIIDSMSEGFEIIRLHTFFL